MLHDFFAAYRTNRAPVLDEPEYRAVIDYLDTLAGRDGEVKGVFFADEDSQDYFSNRIPEIPEGRVQEEGYLIKNRPWWHEAVAEDRLYLASPTTDLVTGEVAVVLQTTVYNEGGSLLGVGGMDVLLTTVGELVRNVVYQGQGSAFLVDHQGEIIYFTGADLEVEAKLEDLDLLSEEASGFSNLSARIREGDTSNGEVRWQGNNQFVVLAPVKSESPYINWTLGVILPDKVISGPVRANIVKTVLAILLTIALVGILTALVTRYIWIRPVRQLLERFQAISGGQADLTQRVEVTSGDELGRLGESFNLFVSRVQEDVRMLGEQTSILGGSSDEMRNLSQQIASANEETSTQASMVSAAAEQVSANVQSVATATEELNANTREIAANASEAAQVATRAVEIAGETRRLSTAGSEREHHRQRRQGDLRDRRTDESAGPQRDHRGCTGGRGRKGLCGRC